MNKPMRIALYYRHIAPPDENALRVLLHTLEEKHLDVAIVKEGDDVHTYDMLLSIGGDGTLLGTLQFARNSGSMPPVLGINFGHLGFLTAAPKDGVVAIVEDLIANNYTIENRTLLQWQVVSQDDKINSINPQLALNEVSLHRREDCSLLHTKVYVNGEYVADYSGDGTIVATPTGSTAYSLSCGGPILTPDSHTFIITPIAPHTLTLRPIIVPDTSAIRLVTLSDSLIFGTDAKRMLLKYPIDIELKKAETNMRLVRTGTQSFFSAIREKLMWGTGIRPM